MKGVSSSRLLAAAVALPLACWAERSARTLGSARIAFNVADSFALYSGLALRSLSIARRAAAFGLFQESFSFRRNRAFMAGFAHTCFDRADCLAFSPGRF
jgi:hypothetical protein